MVQLTIHFFDEISKRNKPPQTYEAFNNYIDSYYGLKEIKFSTDSLGYSYKDPNGKNITITNEEEYAQFLVVFSQEEVSDIFVNVVNDIKEKEQKNKGGYLEYMQKVVDEETELLKTKLKLLLTDENLVKELPIYLNVSQISCSNCNSLNIIGPVYKCVICDDYHLCEKCSYSHTHPMLKIIG